jgi:hypothetical protein
MSLVKENLFRSSCKVVDIFVRFLPNLDFLRQIFMKVPNIKFHGNSCSGSRAGTWGQTDRQAGRHGMDMTKVICDFRVNAYAPKNIVLRRILALYNLV